jgi:hypothetical protein
MTTTKQKRRKQDCWDYLAVSDRISGGIPPRRSRTYLLVTLKWCDVEVEKRPPPFKNKPEARKFLETKNFHINFITLEAFAERD